jgi:Mg/Co/Ni transporter MgtE
LTLQDNPTPENLAAFLNIPPQKLGEFLNMLTPDELNEVFEKILPKGARENILTGLNPTERVEIEKKLQSFSPPPS